MSSPMVSICSITYNHAPFIRQCLDGFLMQQCNFSIEIIINDDCSTDGTTEIIREYAKKYPDKIFPIFHEENQYSKGVRGMLKKFVFPKARGKYIALCEGDDYWTDPLKLQKQVDFLESHPDYSMCFHKAKVIAQDNREPFDFFSSLEEREYKSEDILNHWVVPTASILFRASVHVPIHKDFSVGDIIIHAACVASGRVYCMAEEMSVYRLHAGGWGAHKYDYLNHAIKQLPCRLAMLEVFPRKAMKPLKRLVAYRCCLWFRHFYKYDNLIHARYILKALVYCNYELLRWCAIMAGVLLLKRMGLKISYTYPE